MIKIIIITFLSITAFSQEKMALGDLKIFETKSENNQKIELGFKFLHNFMYNQAQYEFEKALSLQENPWAYIGLLASYHHSLWHFTDYTKASKVLPKVYKYTKQDNLSAKILRAYVTLYKTHDKHKFSNAIAKIYQEYPNNAEVAAVYGLSLMADKDDLKNSRNVLLKALVKYPNHPGLLHYNIHAHDVDDLSIVKTAMPYAEHYFKIAPNASHGQHMPSHLHVRLGMWDNSITSNKASIAASNKICNYYKQDAFCDYENKLHAIEWLHYSYLQAGKDKEAEQVLKDLGLVRKDKYSVEINNIYTVMLSRSILYGLDRESEQIKPIITKDYTHYWAVYSEVSWLIAKAVTQGNLANIEKIINRLKQIDKLCKREDRGIKVYIKLGIMQSEAALELARGNESEAIKTLIKAQDVEYEFMHSSSPPSLGLLTASEYLAAIYKSKGDLVKYSSIMDKIQKMFPKKREYKIFDR